MAVQIPRGTQDLLPGVVEKWQYVESLLRKLSKDYHYKEIRTPIFEHTEVFQKSVGDTTDIVTKEMYTFTDRGDRSLTLRPEGTASVARSFNENKLFGQPDQPVKLYYNGPMFRYERPQAGRFRQFVQYGVEALGSKDPAIDAEVISMALDVYKRAGLKNLSLVINSLGDKEVRETHKKALIAHFEPRIDEFCTDCQVRLEKNPLRVLDCKKDRNHELMKTAPSILDYLNEESRNYFDEVLGYLDALGVEYVVDPTLVRGLDYYQHTAFEIMSSAEGFGAITTLCGGGRYNGPIQDMGGPETPGIGFGLSIERLLAAIEAEGIAIETNSALDCYVIAVDGAAKTQAMVLLQKIREANFSAEKDYLNRKMKAQLKSANRQQARFTIILGEDEIQNNSVLVKNMETGEQETYKTEEFLAKLQDIFTV